MSEKSYLYQQIYDHLVGRILSGELAAGSRLPTEIELKDQFGVSRITSKKALNMLAENGYAIRRPGLGTFVLSRNGSKASACTQLVRGAQALPAAQQGATALPAETKILGLVMERIDESYGLYLFYEIDRQAAALGYTLLVRLSYGNQRRESEALRFLVQAGAKGILIMPTHGKHYNTDLLRLVLDKYPVVLVDRCLHGIPANSVSTDNVKGSFDLTEHLIEKGHREIGFIMLPPGEALSLDDRLAGYHNALVRHGILIGDDWVLQTHLSTMPSLESPDGAQNDVAQIKAYLQAHPQITAVIASEYNIAPMIRSAAAQLGRSIPEDLAVACFDDYYDYTGRFTYTHVKQDEPALAEKAVKKLSDMIESGETNARFRNYHIPGIFRLGSST